MATVLINADWFSPLAYFFIALVAIWVLIWMVQRYRSLRLAGLASELGMRLLAKDPLGIPQRYGQLGLFRQGHARRARNVMIGTSGGRRMHLFDYLYETGLGRDRQTQQFSVVVVGLNRDFPALLVRPAGAYHNRYNLSGLERIDSAWAGSKHGYEVFCEQPDFAEQQISGDLLAKLSQGQNPTLELRQGSLALYLPRKLNPGRFDQLRKLAGELAEHFAPSRK